MGLLSIFSRNGRAKLIPIPKGSFTIDRFGRIMTSTLPGTYPEASLVEIGRKVVTAFETARSADLPMNELHIQFSALKIHARELRGGAILFLTPTSAHKSQ